MKKGFSLVGFVAVFEVLLWLLGLFGIGLALYAMSAVNDERHDIGIALIASIQPLTLAAVAIGLGSVVTLLRARGE